MFPYSTHLYENTKWVCTRSFLILYIDRVRHIIFIQQQKNLGLSPPFIIVNSYTIGDRGGKLYFDDVQYTGEETKGKVKRKKNPESGRVIYRHFILFYEFNFFSFVFFFIK